MNFNALARKAATFLKSLCLCAIRGAATPESMAWLQTLETTNFHNDAARANALKAIKRHLA